MAVCGQGPWAQCLAPRWTQMGFAILTLCFHCSIMTQRVKNSPKQAQLGVTSLRANRMQIYIQKCPKIELRNRIAVRIRSVCSWSDFEGEREVKSSKFKVIYPALVLTLWRELSYLAISITFSLIMINMCMQIHLMHIKSWIVVYFLAYIMILWMGFCNVWKICSFRQNWLDAGSDSYGAWIAVCGHWE